VASSHSIDSLVDLLQDADQSYLDADKLCFQISAAMKGASGMNSTLHTTLVFQIEMPVLVARR
jgi:hypothetical protein